MANVANCKKCGALFIQSSKRDICDKCFEVQNKMVSELNTFVVMYPEETISLDIVLEKFDLTKSEFLALLAAGKFVRVAKKITTVCTKCGKIVSVANMANSLCNDCTRKLQNEI